MAAAVPGVQGLDYLFIKEKPFTNFDGMLGIYYPKIFNQTSK